jgi:hypothetical protein
LIETHGQDVRATTPLEQLAQENKSFMDKSTDFLLLVLVLVLEP